VTLSDSCGPGWKAVNHGEEEDGMAGRTITLVIDENGTILECAYPDGKKGDWKTLSTPLGEAPETVTSVIVPLEILRTVEGRACVHQGCRKVCF
jgi:hypothetical protein